MKNAHFALKTRLVATLSVVIVLGLLLGFASTSPSWRLLDLRFNPYAIITSISIVLYALFIGILANKPSKTEERTWLLLFLAVLFVYAICALMQEISADPHAAIFWNALSSIIIVASPAIFLFSLTYTNQSDRRYPGLTILLLSATFVIFFFAVFTNVIYINELRYAIPKPWGFDFRTAVGPAELLVVFFYLVMAGAAIVLLIRFRHHTQNEILRKQSLFIIAAFSFSMLSGVLFDAVLPAFGLSNLPPFDAILGAPVAFMLVYGLLHYQVLTVSPTIFSNTVLAIMQEAVVVTDQQFKVIFLNERAEKLLGFTLDNNKTALPSLITSQTLPTFRQAFEPGSAKDETITLEHIDIKTPHTELVPVRITSSYLRQGEYDTYIMVLTDISQELQIRSIIEREVVTRTRELHEARSYLVASINSLEQGFLLVNREANLELSNTVADVLLKFTKISGKRPLRDIFANAPWHKDAGKVVTDVLTRHKSRKLELSSIDGSFYQIYVTPVLSGSQILGAAIIIEDVTEQKILDRSKDEFFSIASHELRTPLTAIRGNMSMIKGYFPDAMKDASLSAMIDDTHVASIRLIEIVNDFLDSSKLEQGKMEFHLVPIAVGPIVSAVAEDILPILKVHRNTIVVKGLDQLPKALVDENRLRQILYNLLSNATKYTNDGTITVSGEVDHNKLSLRVGDTGKGIPPDGRKLLFHKFQQASANILTRDDTKGTGLGLYISRLLAINMHGSVELEHTEVDKGSTFLLKIPIADKKP